MSIEKSSSNGFFGLKELAPSAEKISPGVSVISVPSSIGSIAFPLRGWRVTSNPG
jgi:hypothetical protein